MDLTSEVSKKVEGVASRAEHFLQGVDPSPFSSAAFSVLKEKITQFVADLVSESTAAAKRDQADSISAKHVEVASRHLMSSARARIYKHLGTWGGTFLGVSSSAFVSMILAHQFPVSGIVIGAATGIAGAFLLGVSSKE